VIVSRMATRTEAVAALRNVASQGEAEHLRSGEKMEDSHFDRFAKIFRSYQAILKNEPAWTPSHLVPVNPFAGEAKYAPDDTTPITAKESLTWASLFNVRHRMLLTLLTYTFRIASDAPETSDLRRGPMLARIFGEMYNLKAIAGVLVRMPLGDPLRAERAGPPFQMPYTLTPPLPEANFWRMQIDLLSASGELVRELLERKGRSQTPMDGTRYLRALREADGRHHAWIDRVLEGMTTSRRRRV
jgi:hypothetical protein